MNNYITTMSTILIRNYKPDFREMIKNSIVYKVELITILT